MRPRPAQYLLRCDDLCPTMSAAGWERFALLIEEFKLRPILAVVPDNRDLDLIRESARPDFWERMRALESAGAAIALHGYRHVCQNGSKGLLPLSQRSEFAGVDEGVQQRWIREGMEILEGHGLTPRLFVAPRHGFDRGTLRALRKEGLGFLCDGYARVPRTRGGVVWIPQQLWGPLEKADGLWTICIHSNTAENRFVEGLRIFIKGHADQFTSFDRVLGESRTGGLELEERAYEAIASWRARASRLRAQLMGRRRPGGWFQAWRGWPKPGAVRFRSRS